jgi:predicted RNase H-like HicB family nuclease
LSYCRSPDRTINSFTAFGGGESSFRIRNAIFQLAQLKPYTETPAGKRTEQVNDMSYYIALIHKDADSCYGVSFPDVPGVFTAGDTIDEAMRKAGEVLEFAAEDWSGLDGDLFPAPRTIDELRVDPDFQERAREAVVAAVPFRAKIETVA